MHLPLKQSAIGTYTKPTSLRRAFHFSIKNHFSISGASFLGAEEPHGEHLLRWGGGGFKKIHEMGGTPTGKAQFTVPSSEGYNSFVMLLA